MSVEQGTETLSYIKKALEISRALVPPMVRKSNQIHRRFEAFVSIGACHFVKESLKRAFSVISFKIYALATSTLFE
jgi:hypothetical protein